MGLKVGNCNYIINMMREIVMFEQHKFRVQTYYFKLFELENI